MLNRYQLSMQTSIFCTEEIPPSSWFAAARALWPLALWADYKVYQVDLRLTRLSDVHAFIQ